MTKFDMVTHNGRGLVIRGSATPLHIAQMRGAVCQFLAGKQHQHIFKNDVSI